MRTRNAILSLTVLSAGLLLSACSAHPFIKQRSKSGTERKISVNVELASQQLSLTGMQPSSLMTQLVCKSPEIDTGISNQSTYSLNSLSASGCEIRLHGFSYGSTQYSVVGSFSQYGPGGRAQFSGSDGSTAMVDVVSQLSSPLTDSGVLVAYHGYIATSKGSINGKQIGSIHNSYIDVGIDSAPAAILESADFAQNVIGNVGTMTLTLSCPTQPISESDICGISPDSFKIGLLEAAAANLSLETERDNINSLRLQNWTVENSKLVVRYNNVSLSSKFTVLFAAQTGEGYSYAEVVFASNDVVASIESMLTLFDAGQYPTDEQMDAALADLQQFIDSSDTGLALTNPDPDYMARMEQYQMLLTAIYDIRTRCSLNELGRLQLQLPLERQVLALDEAALVNMEEQSTSWASDRSDLWYQLRLAQGSVEDQKLKIADIETRILTLQADSNQMAELWRQIYALLMGGPILN